MRIRTADPCQVRHTDVYGLQWKHLDAIVLSYVAERISGSK